MNPFATASTRTQRLVATALLTCLALSGMSCSKQNRMATSPAGSTSLDQTSSSRTAPPPVTDLPILGSANAFAVLGGSTVTSTGLSVLDGDLGVSPGTAITGFGPGVVSGAIHAGDPVAAQAQLDLTAGYNTLAAMVCTTRLTGQDLGGMILGPGVYCFASSAQLTGSLVLDAQGNPDAVFVFQIGSTLVTAVNSSVVVINGGRVCNVFWQVGSSATLGTGTKLAGNVIAVASITLNHGVVLSGRALARSGAVTMDADSVSSANCSSGAVVQCRQRMKGDGSIAVSGGTASFNFDVRLKKDGRVKGSLQYVNHVTGKNLVMRDLTSLVIAGNNATFTGTGTRDGVAGTYTVSVVDAASPLLADQFSIAIAGGLTESGNVTTGDIRIYDKKCGHDGEDEGDDDDGGDGHDGHGDKDHGDEGHGDNGHGKGGKGNGGWPR